MLRKINTNKRSDSFTCQYQHNNAISQSFPHNTAQIRAAVPVARKQTFEGTAFVRPPKTPQFLSNSPSKSNCRHVSSTSNYLAIYFNLPRRELKGRKAIKVLLLRNIHKTTVVSTMTAFVYPRPVSSFSARELS